MVVTLLQAKKSLITRYRKELFRQIHTSSPILCLAVICQDYGSSTDNSLLAKTRDQETDGFLQASHNSRNTVEISSLGIFRYDSLICDNAGQVSCHSLWMSFWPVKISSSSWPTAITRVNDSWTSPRLEIDWLSFKSGSFLTSDYMLEMSGVTIDSVLAQKRF